MPPGTTWPRSAARAARDDASSARRAAVAAGRCGAGPSCASGRCTALDLARARRRRAVRPRAGRRRPRRGSEGGAAQHRTRPRTSRRRHFDGWAAVLVRLDRLDPGIAARARRRGVGLARAASAGGRTRDVTRLTRSRAVDRPSERGGMSATFAPHRTKEHVDEPEPSRPPRQTRTSRSSPSTGSWPRVATWDEVAAACLALPEVVETTSGHARAPVAGAGQVVRLGAPAAAQGPRGARGRRPDRSGPRRERARTRARSGRWSRPSPTSTSRPTTSTATPPSSSASTSSSRPR